jgi:hypothetical protein
MELISGVGSIAELNFPEKSLNFRSRERPGWVDISLSIIPYLLVRMSALEDSKIYPFPKAH